MKPQKLFRLNSLCVCVCVCVCGVCIVHIVQIWYLENGLCNQQPTTNNQPTTNDQQPTNKCKPISDLMNTNVIIMAKYEHTYILDILVIFMNCMCSGVIIPYSHLSSACFHDNSQQMAWESPDQYPLHHFLQETPPCHHTPNMCAHTCTRMC